LGQPSPAHLIAASATALSKLKVSANWELGRIQELVVFFDPNSSYFMAHL
jgi:hypothetical protein